jgi:hypothetical protein
MPAHSDARATSHPWTKLLHAHRLYNVKISVKINPTMAIRELDAVDDFSDLSYEPELLGEIRLAIISDPSRNTNVVYGNLTWGLK